MESIPNFSNISLASKPIELWFSQTNALLAIGTAFFYRKNFSTFLITNWHNVTGINPLTKEPLAKHAGRPDIIRFKLFKKQGDEFEFFDITAKLYADDYMEVPSWFVHPKYKEQVDVVALEINFPSELNCIAINDTELEFKEFSGKIADEVFILGFPYNVRQKDIFPIWKRASIASEPEFDYEDKPIILVDTASRSGMSGAPVILRSFGIWEEPNPGFGFRKCFLGIYSGRILGKSELDAQLGIVWKKHLIAEIIDSKVNDNKASFANFIGKS